MLLILLLTLFSCGETGDAESKGDGYFTAYYTRDAGEKLKLQSNLKTPPFTMFFDNERYTRVKVESEGNGLGFEGYMGNEDFLSLNRPGKYSITLFDFKNSGSHLKFNNIEISSSKFGEAYIEDMKGNRYLSGENFSMAEGSKLIFIPSNPNINLTLVEERVGGGEVISTPLINRSRIEYSCRGGSYFVTFLVDEKEGILSKESLNVQNADVKILFSSVINSIPRHFFEGTKCSGVYDGVEVHRLKGLEESHATLSISSGIDYSISEGGALLEKGVGPVSLKLGIGKYLLNLNGTRKEIEILEWPTIGINGGIFQEDSSKKAISITDEIKLPRERDVFLFLLQESGWLRVSDLDRLGKYRLSVRNVKELKFSVVESGAFNIAPRPIKNRDIIYEDSMEDYILEEWDTIQGYGEYRFFRLDGGNRTQEWGYLYRFPNPNEAVGFSGGKIRINNKDGRPLLVDKVDSSLILTPKINRYGTSLPFRRRVHILKEEGGQYVEKESIWIDDIIPLDGCTDGEYRVDLETIYLQNGEVLGSDVSNYYFSFVSTKGALKSGDLTLLDGGIGLVEGPIELKGLEEYSIDLYRMGAKPVDQEMVKSLEDKGINEVLIKLDKLDKITSFENSDLSNEIKSPSDTNFLWVDLKKRDEVVKSYRLIQNPILFSKKIENIGLNHFKDIKLGYLNTIYSNHFYKGGGSFIKVMDRQISKLQVSVIRMEGSEIVDRKDLELISFRERVDGQYIEGKEIKGIEDLDEGTYKLKITYELNGDKKEAITNFTLDNFINPYLNDKLPLESVDLPDFIKIGRREFLYSRTLFTAKESGHIFFPEDEGFVFEYKGKGGELRVELVGKVDDLNISREFNIADGEILRIFDIFKYVAGEDGNRDLIIKLDGEKVLETTIKVKHSFPRPHFRSFKYEEGLFGQREYTNIVDINRASARCGYGLELLNYHMFHSIAKHLRIDEDRSFHFGFAGAWDSNLQNLNDVKDVIELAKEESKLTSKIAAKLGMKDSAIGLASVMDRQFPILPSFKLSPGNSISLREIKDGYGVVYAPFNEMLNLLGFQGVEDLFFMVTTDIRSLGMEWLNDYDIRVPSLKWSNDMEDWILGREGRERSYQLNHLILSSQKPFESLNVKVKGSKMIVEGLNTEEFNYRLKLEHLDSKDDILKSINLGAGSKIEGIAFDLYGRYELEISGVSKITGLEFKHYLNGGVIK